jgi:ribosomal protein S4
VDIFYGSCIRITISNKLFLSDVHTQQAYIHPNNVTIVRAVLYSCVVNPCGTRACSIFGGLFLVWCVRALSISATLIPKHQSWSPKNLYNLWRRTTSDDFLFKSTSDDTLFQQRWKSKAAVRAYHGDYIPEKVFKRWYLPDSLPDVRPRRQVFSGDNLDLELYARRKLKEKKEEEETEEKGLAPVGSLMFSEVERRIDTVVFRSCFAHSIYEARRLIIHGDVMLNGKKVCLALLLIYQGCLSRFVCIFNSIQMRPRVLRPEI